jgi:hypothetical protein
MAGPRTRFGFAGTDGPEGAPGPRSSPTLHGHAVHHGPGQDLDRAPLLARPAPESVAPSPEPVEAPAVAEVAGRPPTHSGKSNYPSIARLYGRWDEDGKLISDEPPVADPTMDDDDLLVVPRQRVFPPWMLVVIAAALSFAVMAFLLHGRQRPAPPAPTVGSLPADRQAPAARVHEQPAMVPPEAAPARPRVASRGRDGATRHRRPARAATLTDDALPPSF